MKTKISSGLIGIGIGLLISLLIGLITNIVIFREESYDIAQSAIFLFGPFLLPGTIIGLLLGIPLSLAISYIGILIIGDTFYYNIPTYLKALEIPMVIIFSIFFWFKLGVITNWLIKKIKLKLSPQLKPQPQTHHHSS